MTKRIFVAASLLATVCAAHAEVLPAAAASSQASFLDQWTDAAGNNVAASNVLGSNMRLVGGVALGNESAAQALMQKASAAAANGAAVTVKRANGITGTYALAKSNYKAAAAAGNGVSITSNSNGDMIVSRGQTGGGQDAGDAGSGGSGSSSSSGASGATGGSSTGGSVTTAGPVLTPAGSDLGNLGTLPVVKAGGAGAVANAESPSGEVPEPSTIALMIAGMAGVMSIARRRTR